VTPVNVAFRSFKYDGPAPKNCKEAMTMERLWKTVCGVLAVLTVGTVVAMAPGAALAQDTGGNGIGAATGGVTLDPAFQVGNAQGDGSGR